MSLKQTFKAAYLARSFWIDIKTYHLHCLHTGDVSANFYAIGFFNEADTHQFKSELFTLKMGLYTQCQQDAA
jgi:hypothetical protein